MGKLERMVCRGPIRLTPHRKGGSGVTGEALLGSAGLTPAPVLWAGCSPWTETQLSVCSFQPSGALGHNVKEYISIVTAWPRSLLQE